MIVWIENHLTFDTVEGIRQLDQVCTCQMPAEGSEVYELVTKTQIHRHTHTCKKNHTAKTCRFSFPRLECAETRIIAHIRRLYP